MAGEATVLTAEQAAALQAQVEALTTQVRGIAAERDQYRAQVQQFNGGGAPPVATGHVLARATGIQDFDWGQVDQHYVTRAQYTQDLQRAVNQAYALANGETDMKLAIRDASGRFADLSKFDSSLSKKTVEVLTRDGYAEPRKDGYGNVRPVRGWQDLSYTDTLALQRAAGVAKSELVEETAAAAAADAAAKAGQGAVGMAGGGAPVGTGAGASAADWDRAAASGDLAQIKTMVEAHVQQVTGTTSP